MSWNNIREVARGILTHLQGQGRRPRRRKAERGMTLVEIMVVVIIMALVTGVVGVAVFNALGDAQGKVAQTQIGQISEALDMYKLRNRKYPSTSEGLNALVAGQGNSKPVMDQLPRDPWGNDYIYIYPGTHNPGRFDLMSYGEDGVQGNDDITNWTTAE